MKALKASLAVLAVGFLLTACGGSDWTGEVRFKVSKVTEGEVLVSGQKERGRVSLELDQDQPASAISSPWAFLDQTPAGTAVGDKLICTVEKRDDSKLDDAEAVQTITACRKA